MHNKTFLITGGNQGLGLDLTRHFNGTSVSRSTGHNIVDNKDAIAKLSLDYDVFINNAYDGVFGQGRTAYGQAQLLNEVAMTWQQHDKTGQIISIGGVGSEDCGPPSPGWESYNANKAALKHQSQQWTQAFKSSLVSFKTTVLTVDRLDTPVGRQRPTWTGNGVDSDQVINMITLCLNSKHNICVGEIVVWVNLDHK